MSLYKRGEVYWTQFKIQGRTFRKSCNTRVREIAEQHQKALQESFRKNLQYIDAGRISLSAIGALDLARAKRQGQTDYNLKHGILHHWRMLQGFFEADGVRLDPSTLQPDDIERYIDHRIEQGARPQTYKREVQALKRAMKLGCVRYKYVMPFEDDKWPKFRNLPKSASRRGKLWPTETILQWLEKLSPECRDENLFIWHTALRKEEMLRLKPEMIHRTPGGEVPGVLLLPDWVTKTKTARRVGLLPEALDALDRQLARRTKAACDKGVIFSGRNFKKQMAAAAAEMGLPHNITRRDLRHSFLSMALANGADIKGLMEMAGHKTISAADLYQSSTPERTAHSVLAFKKAQSEGKGTQGTVKTACGPETVAQIKGTVELDAEGDNGKIAV